MNIARLLILAALVAFVSFLALPSSPALGAAYVVDTTDDDPGVAKTACTGAADDCSLRGAMINANAASTPGDVITFDAAVFNPGTIAIASVLPTLTGGGDTIDGAGATVIIDSTDEARGFNCLIISSAGNTIKNLQFTDCNTVALMSSGASDNNTIGPGNTMFDNEAGVAISVATATGNTIIGNKIGTNAAGTAIPGEGGNGTGVAIVDGASNTVGGATAADRNIISGNQNGIFILGTGATGNEVYGNYIGTDATGTVDLGNSNGVLVQDAPSNTIGGTLSGQGNLISGNTFNVQLSTNADNNTVSGNLLGPDANGGGALVSSIGVLLSGVSGNTIGPGNVISDNSSSGVRISSAGVSANVVKGNLIGTNPGGTAGLPNGGDGIAIQDSAGPNTIGGTNPGDGNVIAFNTGDGIEVNGSTAPAATGNAIRGNSIRSNGGLEINNVSGGNLELAPPVLGSTLGGTSVSGTACASCVVDVFSDSATDARFYEGSVTAAGDGSFTFNKEAPLVGPNLTATNTDADGNTSELSFAVPLDTDGDGTGDLTDNDDDNDTIVDGNDGCPIFPEDFDGFEDTDGCPDPDNDLDGICDAGQTNVSCTGSDSGEMCFDPAGILSCPTIDCRNVAEDIDAFKDSDGCPEPDNDNDGFPDATDDCPGTDAHAGPDGMLGSPQDLNHNGVSDGAEDPLSTDDVVLVFEDYDGILDGDGCHDSPGDDFDGDGFTDEDEVLSIGTNAAAPCGTDGWPADLVDDVLVPNGVSILDLTDYIEPIRYLGTDVADWPAGSGPGTESDARRHDLVPGNSGLATDINILDLTVMALGEPPMLNGGRNFNSTCPLPP